MKLEGLVKYLIVFVFISSVLYGGNILIVPIGAGKKDAKIAARKVSESFIDEYEDIDDLSPLDYIDTLSRRQKKSVEKCGASLKCMRNVIKKVNGIDYFVLTNMKFSGKKNTKFKLFIFNSIGKKISGTAIVARKNSSPLKVAVKLRKITNKIVSKYSLAERIEEKKLAEENKKLEKKRLADLAREEKLEQIRLAKEEEAKRLKKLKPLPGEKVVVSKVFKLYRKGDFKKSFAFIKENQNSLKSDFSNELLNEMEQLHKVLIKAEKNMKSENYSAALKLVDSAARVDESIREKGKKLGYFKLKSIYRLVYQEFSDNDVDKVRKIHASFVKELDQLKVWKADKSEKIKEKLNNNIRNREKAAVEENERQKKIQLSHKKYELDMGKGIKAKKYKWEQDDSVIEQKIVQAESNLTMLEQLDKGIVKKKDADKFEKKRELELKKVDKDYKVNIANIKKQNLEFQKNGDKLLSDRHAQYEKKIDDFESKIAKKENLLKNVLEDIEQKKVVFNKKESSISGDIESVSMKNEDNDRKFVNKVEVEYQDQFDALNRELEELDQKEDKLKEKVEAFDKRIEDFMISQVDKLSKYEESFASERKSIEQELKTKKQALEKQKGNEDAIMALDSKYGEKLDAIDMKVAKESEVLQKQTKKQTAKIRREQKVGKRELASFRKKKARSIKQVDKRVKIIQASRDRKFNARKKQRSLLAAKNLKAKSLREKSFNRFVSVDISKKEKLEKDINSLRIKMSKYNESYDESRNKFAKMDEKKSKKHAKTYEVNLELAQRNYDKAKLDVNAKFDNMIVNMKKDSDKKKKALEKELVKLNALKAKKIKNRKKWLQSKKQSWISIQNKWKVAAEKELKKNNSRRDSRRKETGRDKKNARKNLKKLEITYQNKVKRIMEKEISTVKKGFKKEFSNKREKVIMHTKLTKKIEMLKSDLYNKIAYDYLYKDDLIKAKKHFVKALFFNAKNSKAKAGLKTVAEAAKSLYWKGYSMKDTDKRKAKEIFQTLLDTLTPANEYYTKVLITIDQMDIN